MCEINGNDAKGKGTATQNVVLIRTRSPGTGGNGLTVTVCKVTACEHEPPRSVERGPVRGAAWEHLGKR